MKRYGWILGALMSGVLGSLVGCSGKAAPTEPDGGLVHIDKVAVDPSVTGLSGTWSGTITFHAYTDIEGDSSPSPCDGAASITVMLNQRGESLTGEFQSGCGGLLNIRGFVDGANISGSLESSTGSGFGRIFGTVTSNHIHFRTVQLADDEDDNGPDNDGDAAYTSSDVELHRAPTSEREVPVRAAAGGRSPRAFATRR